MQTKGQLNSLSTENIVDVFDYKSGVFNKCVYQDPDRVKPNRWLSASRH